MSEDFSLPGFAAGIVALTDLTSGEAIVPVLEAHIEAGGNRFRGVRQASCWDASPDVPSFIDTPELLMDPKFREGFACLQQYGLSFDALLYHPQLMELVDLARAFPDTSIILDHMGIPLGLGPYAGKRDEVFQEWKRGIGEVASCPNVAIKLGGLGIPPCGFNWHSQVPPLTSASLAEVIAPYYYLCIEQFGVNRCMFLSNFPSDNISYSYSLSWNAFKRITKDFSSEEKAALFHDTAARVYRLTDG
jgi:predicted TIM-barrel fold metal-dependent hydrolase